MCFNLFEQHSSHSSDMMTQIQQIPVFQCETIVQVRCVLVLSTATFSQVSLPRFIGPQLTLKPLDHESVIWITAGRFVSPGAEAASATSAFFTFSTLQKFCL